MIFFEAVKLLFPRSRFFRLVTDNMLRKFVIGMSALPDDVRTEMEKTYSDLFPDTTRALSEWEKQFSVLFASEQYGDTRRGILQSLWASKTGGQSASYLQSLLQKIDSSILVVENIPVSNPRTSNSVIQAVCTNKTLYCAGPKAICSYRLGDQTFTPGIVKNDTESLYDVPNDSKYWEQCFFICKNVVRNNKKEILYVQRLKIDKMWKNYIEYLILKVKPVQTSAIIFIEYI